MAISYFVIIILCLVTISSSQVKQGAGRSKRDSSYQTECCVCDDFDQHKNRHCSEKRCWRDLHSSERRLITQCEYCQYTKLFTGGRWKTRGQCSIEPLCRHDFARTIATPGCFGFGNPTEGTLCDYCCRRPSLLDDPVDYCINDTMNGFTKFTTFAGVSKATPKPIVTTAPISSSPLISSSTTRYIQTSSTLSSTISIPPSPTTKSTIIPTALSASTVVKPKVSSTTTTTRSSMIYSTTESPFICSVCDTTDGRNCNDRNESCPSGKCQNRITFNSNGVIQHVVKSCVLDFLCKTNTKGNDPLCEDAAANKSHPLSTVCYYCCDPQTTMSTKTPCNTNLYAVTGTPSVATPLTSSVSPTHTAASSSSSKTSPQSSTHTAASSSSKTSPQSSTHTAASSSSKTSPQSSTVSSKSVLTTSPTSAGTSSASKSTVAASRPSEYFTSDFRADSSSASVEHTSTFPSSQSSDLTSIQTIQLTTQAKISSPSISILTPTLPSTQPKRISTPKSTTSMASSRITMLGPVCVVCSSTNGKNCNNSVEACPTGKCQTQHTFDKNGGLSFISKRCVPQILCSTYIKINDPVLCDESRTNKSSANGFVCTYCCDPTNTPCNANFYPDVKSNSSFKGRFTTEPRAVTQNDSTAALNLADITTDTPALAHTGDSSIDTDQTASTVPSTSSSYKKVNSTAKPYTTSFTTWSKKGITKTTAKTTKTIATGSASSSWHTKAGATVCMACLDTVEVCDTLYAPVTCEEPNNYCINLMKNSDRGVTTVNRTCGDINRCYREWFQGSSDNDKCQQYMDGQIITVEFECTYCCIKDKCNAKISPDKDSLYNDV